MRRGARSTRPATWALAAGVATAAVGAWSPAGPAPWSRASAQEAGPEAPEAAPAPALPDDEALRDAAFDPARLRARRKALLARLPADAVVVVATGARGPDTFPFRPTPDFLYLSGQRDAGLSLLLAADLDVLFVPPRDLRWELWNGPRIAPGPDAARATGFAEVVAWGERRERVRRALEGKRPLYVAGVEPKELGLDPAPTARQAGPDIAHLRQVKDAHELALLERAVGVTCAALTEAIRSVEPGQREFEVQAVIEHVFLRYGAQRPGFSSIVGGGPRSCVLHYQANRGRLREGDLIVMDVGAELWGYTADVTRTVPVSGRFTARQRAVYDVVLRAQAAGIAAVRPGATLRDVDQAAREVIQGAGYGRAFPHGTCHWLGLDVHDVGAYERALEPGMVLTVEPGVYLPDEGIGIRIEDDVVVTADGCRVLSGGVPRAPDALEALLAGRGLGNAPVAPLPEDGPPSAGGRRYFRLAPR